MKKIIIVSGPPRCGKTTASFAALATLNYEGHDCYVFHTSDIVKEATHAAFGLGPHLSSWAFEDAKEAPNDAFFGLTPRAAYIKMVKTFYADLGLGYLGKAGVRYITRNVVSNNVVVAGVGSRDEAQAYVEAFGIANVLHVRITRPGCTYLGDSREDFTIGHPRTIVNDGEIKQLCDDFTDVARGFFYGSTEPVAGVPSQG